MKKLFGIFLILVLLVPYLGTYSWLQLKKHQIKKEIKAKILSGIDKKELLLLKFSNNTTKSPLKWKHADEFEYRGQMFDIVRREVKSDSIFYYCLNDHAETRFNRQINLLISELIGQNPQKKENQKRLVQLFQSLYYSILPEWNNRPPELGPNPVTAIYLFVYTPVELSPPAPPPKIV